MTVVRGVGLVMLGLFWFSACSGKVIDEKAPDHAFEPCASSRDCGGGLTCLCGVCTRACSTNADCADRPGVTCSTFESTGFNDACYPAPNVPGICLQRCTDGGCSIGTLSCADRWCVPFGCSEATKPPMTSLPVSFRRDVMPIFGLGCARHGCHDAQTKSAGLFLGPPCKFDVATKLCVFVADTTCCAFSEDTACASTCDGATCAGTCPAPLTDQAVADVYAELLAPSKTAPAVARVVPGSPDSSFLVDSVLGRENDRGYTCTNQDPSRDIGPKPCGEPMPLWDVPCETARSRLAASLIIEWIREGAQVD